MITVERRVAAVLAVGGLSALALTAAAYAVPAPTEPVPAVVPEVPQPDLSGLPDLPPTLEGAPIALMLDLGSGRTLYSREADRRFLPASLTKLMTVYTAFEMLDAGTLVANQRIAVGDKTFKEWSGKGSSMFVNRGDVISVDTLLRGIVTVSANDGCVVLAEGAAGSVPGFSEMMNREARALGMNDSHFNTPNGWPDEGRTFTSGRDLATLATALITRHPEKYRRYFGIPSFQWHEIKQNNRNPILGAIEGADGLKTGFTNEAGYGFVGSAQRDGRRLLMVVAGTDSSRERKAIARDFLNWGFDRWQAQRVFGQGQQVASIAVQGGAETAVPLSASRPVFVTGPEGLAPKARITVRYNGPVAAPIRKGQEVAELIVDPLPEKAATPSGGGAVIPLLAAEDVPAANWWQRLRNGLLGLAG